METTDRPLDTLDPSAVDAYIDRAIDELFVPKSAVAEAETPPPEGARSAGENPQRPGCPADIPASPLDGVREAVLSLEWEVCDRNILTFEREARALGERCAPDRYVDAVVQMSVRVSKYLLTVGDGASPTSVEFPAATLRTLEALLREPAPSTAERRSAVERLLQSYQRLQAEARRRPAHPVPAEDEAPEFSPAATPPPSDARAAPPEWVVDATPLTDTPNPVGTSAAPVFEVEEASEIEEVAPSVSPPGAELPLEDLPAPVPSPWDRSGDSLEPGFGAAEPAPDAGAAADQGNTVEQLLACLEGLREAALERLDRAHRAAPLDPPRWGDETSALRELLDTGLTSALGLARLLASAPAGGPASTLEDEPTTPETAAWTTDLARIHGAIEALATTVRTIESRLGGPTGNPLPASQRDTAQTSPPPVAPGAAPAYLAAIGGSPVAIPAPLLVKAVPLSSRRADRIRARGYATLGEFRRPFRSLTSGLSGPLARLSKKDLGLVHFPVAPQSAGAAAKPGAAVLLSDGRTHAVLFTDRLPEEVSQAAPGHPLFQLGETGVLSGA